MSVTFKKILRKSPFDKEGTGKYYPQLITWGKPATLNTIAKQMKEKSSLTLGDIKSVLTNFVEVTRSELYNGHAVNIENFGSLHAAYMVVALVYAIIGKCRWYVITLFAVIMLGIWGTAVYSCHHYIIDVLLGISCALLGWLVFEYGLMKIPAFNRFFDRYYKYIK